MEWHLVTCSSTRHIIPAQQWLFEKYVPDAEVHYIDVVDEPVEDWTHNVLRRLGTDEEYIIFGLDDFLPIDYFPELPEIKIQVANDDVDGMYTTEFDRLELGWGGSRKGKDIGGGLRLYGHEENYRVSCQFSIWRTEALREQLRIKRSPWKFETKGRLDGPVLSLTDPWRYIEESALSGRQAGKINLCGMRKDDIDALVRLKLIDADDIVYGWPRNRERTAEAYGTKYAAYYE